MKKKLLAVAFATMLSVPFLMPQSAAAHSPYTGCLYTPGNAHYYNGSSERDVMLYGYWADLYTYVEGYEHQQKFGWGCPGPPPILKSL